MAILDSKGRLFGKVSIIDFGAALVILLVVVGIFFFPGDSGSVAQLNSTKPVEVDIIVRGLSLLEPDVLVNQLEETKKTNIVIRKQPYGQVDVKSVKILRRSVLVPQPDGSIKELPDPRPSFYGINMLLTLGGKATITKDGVVLGNSKIKIGTPVELEGRDYNFNASVINVRVE
ncbi:MAG: DUF4330 domain-containing protein [Moorea sp. SIO4A3]|nr:DUF4330 domain-containing protein [Moorena sp. SIO4A3]